MGLIDLQSIGDLLKDVREAITGTAIKDPVKKAELETKIQAMENSLKQGQIQTNIEEAKSKNWFVAGARPFIIWVCGFAILYSFILAPFLHSIFSVFNVNFPLPKIEIGALFNLLLAMLGLAGMRTYEKSKGVNGNHA